MQMIAASRGLNGGCAYDCNHIWVGLRTTQANIYASNETVQIKQSMLSGNHKEKIVVA